TGDAAPDRVHPVPPQRNEALLPSLPEDAEASRGKVHVLEIERGQLPDADPGAVEDLEDRAVARPEWIIVGGELEQRLHLILLDDLRERARALRRGHERRGVVRPRLPPNDQPVVRAEA